MQLGEFHQQLITKLGSNKRLRPFVCQGNPLECEIMVIGINPANEMEKEFGDYFNEESGFEFSKWESDYVEERKSKGKKSKFSPTRNRLNYLSKNLAEYKIIETNVFCLPTENANSLKSQDKKTLILDFLLQSIRPKIVLVNSKEAVENLSKMFGQNIEISKEKAFVSLKYNQDFEVSIIAINHLFNQSYQLLDDVATMIRKKMTINSL